MKNAVECINLRKRRGGFELGELTFSLPEGCILGVLGENGAGKSTLLKTILGVLKKDSGTVQVLGCEELGKHAEIRERIGFVLDPIGIPDSLTAKDLNSIYKDMYAKWSEEDFQRILKRMDAPENRAFRKLSKGEGMKLAFACALAHEADLLVLDEPTAGLDPSARTEAVNLLYEHTREEGKSVILSSHITSDLEKTADLILILHEGKILFNGPKDELLDRYRYVTGGPDDLEKIDSAKIKAKRTSAYNFEALIETDAVNAEMESRPASLEEIFTAITKGVI